MEFVLKRALENFLQQNRGNSELIRRALVGRRPDLTGDVIATSADKIETTIRYPFNVYGRATVGGDQRSGERLHMLTGPAAGQSWEILVTGDGFIQVAGGVNVNAAGVAAGHQWEIRREQENRAISWLGKAAVRVVVGYPQDIAEIPCYSLILQSSSEVRGSRRIGRLGWYDGQGSAAGPVSTVEVTEFDERVDVLCLGMTPDSAGWLYRIAEYVYRTSGQFLDQIFEGSGFSAQAGPVQQVREYQPTPVYSRTMTVGGSIMRHTERGIEWHVEQQVNPAINNRRVSH